MKRLVVFASGNGSNYAALQAVIAAGELAAQIVCVVCDHVDAYVLTRAQADGVPVIVINYRDYPDKAAAERAIVTQLPPLDLVILAGYMRIIGDTLLAAYPKRIINLHPALLPSFPGRNGILDAYNYGVRITGVTVHYVDAGIDSGEIIAQQAVPIAPKQSLPALEAAIHAAEHQLLPRVVSDLIEEGVI
jgi:phosphoribosylglycinamide formyltransferase-1